MTNICWSGPDIAVIGWIPYFSSMGAMPAGHHYPTSFANHLLYNSGNPAPPQNFADFGDFMNWFYPSNGIGTKEYRAILSLHDVKLRYTKADPVPKVEYQPGSYIGFTPPRCVLSGINISPFKHSQGIGKPISPSEDPLPRDAGAIITHRVEFKLSPWLDQAQRKLTGYWAPFAVIEIRYTLRKTGEINIVVNSSAIPSQCIYLDWQRVMFKDMLANSKPDIDDFMNFTAGCQLAPEQTIYNKTRDGTSC
jgi:hypothetical protein